MGNLPLHPAIVHLPLGLAFVIPLLALGLTFAMWRGWLPGRTWILLVGLQAVLLGGGLLAMNSGEREEERVERVISESPIEAHEEAAEQFVWATGIVLALAAAGLLLPERRRRHAALAVTAGSLVVAALAIRTGHAGGELVYAHGAASAYVDAGPGTAGRALPADLTGMNPGGDRDDD
jgi:uncharacterized membrane protein